ncbi:MAG: four helix bundle protein [Bacteroidetes bacterium]|nr:four helix bundle protein [Bacteroidota bacterium]
MATIKKFEELEIWQLARDLARDVETLIQENNFRHNFTLIDQMRRSSGSIMDNIAEGFEREGNKEFIHFLTIAKGSNGELRSQLYRGLDAHYFSDKEFQILYTKSETLGVKLKNLVTYLNSSEHRGQKFRRQAQKLSAINRFKPIKPFQSPFKLFQP